MLLFLLLGFYRFVFGFFACGITVAIVLLAVSVECLHRHVLCGFVNIACWQCCCSRSDRRQCCFSSRLCCRCNNSAFTAVDTLIYSKATISPVFSGVFSLKWPILWDVRRPMWAREHCRISPPSFLAECRKRRLNQGSFVLLCFVLFAFSGLCLVCVLSVFLICLLSCIFQRVPTWTALYSLIVLMSHSLSVRC